MFFLFLVMIFFRELNNTVPNSTTDKRYYVKSVNFQTIVYSELKLQGYIPEHGSEIYVKFIPRDSSVYELFSYFSKVGEIFQIRLMMTENHLQNRGFAYVSYIKTSFAKEAIKKLHRQPFNLNNLSVQISLDNCRIFVGGIPIAKSKDEIWLELQKNGVQNLVDVIMYRSYKNRAHNRGFVFLEFQTHEDAAHFRSKYLNHLQLWDRPLVIDWSVPIPETDKDVMQTVSTYYTQPKIQPLLAKNL